MNNQREILEDQLESYEAQLRAVESFIRELNDTTAKVGADRSQFADDLFEAEHNLKYYQDASERVRKELADLDKKKETRKEDEPVSNQALRECIGALLVSSVSFAAGMLVGSKLRSKSGSEETRE
ncbi:MAG TPA: hypothetical protein VF553_16200 [Pyrinomonadaceae bacterium]|jgi:septal ring factor EnvC (AmiA/AmiB activator)